MVEVSGLAVTTIPKFIEAKFGEKAVEKWLAKLDPQIRKIYAGTILVNQWYDIDKVFVKPTEILCKMFFDGDEKAAWQFGRFSAEYGLKGVLKVFVKIASVNYFIRRASVVLPNYYKPMTMDIVHNDKGYAVLRIPDFPDIHKLVEYRIGGWMERALEITGNNKEFDIKITQSMADGDDFTEFQIKWS
jgi:hypothetical protein